MAARSALYDAEAIRGFAQALLEAASMPADRAHDVADILLEGDLLGHDTHGLEQLAPYLKEIESGSMRVTGEPLTISDRGAVVAWDGQRLPGPWLVLRAIDLAIERALHYGTASVAIARSHHIACLAAYLQRATDRGLVMLLFSSGPYGATIAPHGGTRAVLSPSPLAAGLPTPGEPVLIDVSTSLTSNALTRRLHREGKRLPHRWLLDDRGNASDDPAVLFATNRGTILPLGGIEAGHKGYALGLLVEALTAGLSGHGRADPAEGWGASVFLQILDPQAFAGLAAFTAQTGFVARQCRENPPRAGFDRVRLPGENGLARRRAQLAGGVAQSAETMAALRPWAERYSIPTPAPIGAQRQE